MPNSASKMPKQPKSNSAGSDSTASSDSYTPLNLAAGTSGASYKRRLRLLSSSGVPIVFTPSSEHGKVSRTLHEMALKLKYDFLCWDCIDGWTNLGCRLNSEARREESSVTQSAIVNPVEALLSIYNRTGPARVIPPSMISDGNPTGGMVFCISYMDRFIRDDPRVQEAIRHLRQDLEVQRKLVVFVVTPGFEIPQEIQHEVYAEPFDLPNAIDLKHAYTFARKAVSEDPEIGSKLPYFTDEEVETICRAGLGTTEQEFVDAICLSYREHEDKLPNVPLTDMVASVSRVKTECVKRSNALEIMPTVTPEQVGGFCFFKAWLSANKNSFSQRAEEFGVVPPKGCLLIGPPGTAKSLSSKMAGHIFNLPCVMFNLSSVFDKYVGSSESRIRAALDMIKTISPCVVFIDEIDKAGLSPTGGSDSGVGTRVLGQILTFMQENHSKTFFIFSANRMEGIPPELVRAGRVSKIWFVGMPNAKSREDIFKIHLHKRKQTYAIDLRDAVTTSKGYSGAEIEEAVNESVSEAFNMGSLVTPEILLAKLRGIKPFSVSQKERLESMTASALQIGTPVDHLDDDKQDAATVRRRRPDLNNN